MLRKNELLKNQYETILLPYRKTFIVLPAGSRRI